MQEDDQLRRLFHQGLSYSQIGKEMGRTRNSCIGRAMRLGFPARIVGVTEKARMERIRDRRDSGVKSSRKYYQKNRGVLQLPFKQRELPEMEFRVPNIPPVSIMELNDRTCRWPIGDGPFMFCGALPLHEKPYCPFHDRIAHEPEPRRPRSKVRLPGRILPVDKRAA
jgi:GcrA cell cycle regulator